MGDGQKASSVQAGTTRWTGAVLALAAIGLMAAPAWGQTAYPNRAISPEATARHVADEIARWKAVAQRAGVRLD